MIERKRNLNWLMTFVIFLSACGSETLEDRLHGEFDRICFGSGEFGDPENFIKNLAGVDRYENVLSSRNSDDEVTHAVYYDKDLEMFVTLGKKQQTVHRRGETSTKDITEHTCGVFSKAPPDASEASFEAFRKAFNSLNGSGEMFPKTSCTKYTLACRAPYGDWGNFVLAQQLTAEKKNHKDYPTYMFEPGTTYIAVTRQKELNGHR